MLRINPVLLALGAARTNQGVISNKISAIFTSAANPATRNHDDADILEALRDLKHAMVLCENERELDALMAKNSALLERVGLTYSNCRLS